MEQTGRVIVAICLAAVIGLGVPAMPYSGIRRGAELSRFVEKLKKK